VISGGSVLHGGVPQTNTVFGRSSAFLDRTTWR